MCNIYVTNQFVIKMYLYLICSVKLDIQSIKILIINQHKNNMFHVQSLEKGKMTFTFAPLVPLIMFSLIKRFFITCYVIFTHAINMNMVVVEHMYKD
jgi:hypothetical protein